MLIAILIRCTFLIYLKSNVNLPNDDRVTNFNETVIKYFKKRKLSTLFFCYLSSSVFANERLYLKQAEILENKTIDGKSVKLISGDIVFKKGDLTLNCENGIQYVLDDLAILYDGIYATQNERKMTCDTIKFFSNDNILHGIGNSHVWDIDYNLVADSITIFTEIDSGIAAGNVTLIQKGQIINSDRIKYKREKGKKGVSYTAIGNVIIKDSSIIAKCGKATYSHSDRNTTLEINPQINESERILSGERIFLSYENEKLKELHIPQKANVITIAKGYQKSVTDSMKLGDSLSLKNKIEGKKLISFFNNGKIDSIRIEGMAKTLYHVFKDSIYQGNNNVSGDTITMSFLDNELNTINVLGGSEGEYFPDSVANKIKLPIIYKANKIQYQLMNNESDLFGNVSINHDGTNLDAGFVNVNWQNNMLEALGRAKEDTISDLFHPIISEDSREPMTGKTMMYNLKTRKGRITQGQTKADDGFYSGKKIRNESERVFLIENSAYTTCDLDTSHFHFQSKMMKIIQNDVVIARPIILHLGQIPVFGLPFGIFPHKGGQRHSGWIMPGYGDNKNRGQYIQGLGYYWVPSEYWDSKFLLGFGDKQGATFRIDTQYHIRYKFRGNLNFFNRQYLSGTNDILNLPDNRNSSSSIKWTHKHELRNNQSLNANVTYSTSGEYNKKFGQNEADRMNQKAISNVSYSKRWPKSKISFSAIYYSNIDLLIKDKVNPESNFYVEPKKEGTEINISNITFPKFSFRRAQTNLFPTSATKKKWYNTIGWNYGLTFENRNRDYYQSVESESMIFDWNKDSVSNEKKDAWIHTSSINAPQKLFKHISINPSINIKSIWVNQTKVGVWKDSTIEKYDQSGFAARTTGSFSINGNTKIYGLFPIPFGPVKTIRHVMSPSIGFSWTPDFSKDLFGVDLGYFSDVTDEMGNVIDSIDRFSGTMAGSTPRTERKSINFGLNNIFQAKLNTSDKEKKIDLMSWRMNTSYNFAADSLHFSNLRSSIRTKLAGKLNLDISMTHDFYDFDKNKNRRTKEYNKNSNGIIFPRLIGARISTGFRLVGKSWANTDNIIEKDTIETKENIPNTESTNSLQGIRNTIGNKNLWNTSVSLSYTHTETNPANPNKTFWANTTTTLNLTKKWRISHRARFDLNKRELISHSFSVYRDLHCWELSLNWTPTGIGQGIYFKLNVKSATLQDLKIEKRDGIYTGAGL